MKTSVDSRHRLPETCCESSRSSPQRRLPLVTLSASLSSMPVNEVCRFASTMHTFPQTCTARVCATLKQISVTSPSPRPQKTTCRAGRGHPGRNTCRTKLRTCSSRTDHDPTLEPWLALGRVEIPLVQASGEVVPQNWLTCVLQ